VSDAEATAVENVLKKKMIAFIQNGVLNINNQLSDSQVVEMYNVSGQIQFSKTFPAITTISVESYPAGMYLLQIKSANQTCQLKIVI